MSSFVAGLALLVASAGDPIQSEMIVSEALEKRKRQKPALLCDDTNYGQNHTAFARPARPHGMAVKKRARLARPGVGRGVTPRSATSAT